MPPRVAVVLHYECCSFPRWRRKYAQLAASHSPADTAAVVADIGALTLRQLSDYGIPHDAARA